MFSLRILAFALLSVHGAFAAPAEAAAPTPAANSTLGPVPLAVGGFAQSCSSWGGTYGNVGSHGIASLQATCFNTAGGEVTTTLDLNNCMGNFGGSVACADGGNWLATCTIQNSLTTGNTVLDATCGDGRGGFDNVQFDINACVGNLNGNLAC